MAVYSWFLCLWMLNICFGVSASDLKNLRITGITHTKEILSQDVIKDLYNRLTSLEHKVIMLEEKDKAKERDLKRYHKSLTKVRRQNKILKQKVQFIQEKAENTDRSPWNMYYFINKQTPGASKTYVPQTKKNIDNVQHLNTMTDRLDISNPKKQPGVHNRSPSVESVKLENNELLQAIGQGSIRFNAQPTKRITYQGSRIIQFPDVKVNNGNGFNSTSGVFTCPQSGLYIFGVTMSASTDLATVYIFQNNNWVARTYVGSNQGTASMIALMQLKKGDKILVENASNQENTFDEFSHFTGARISG